MLSAYLLLRLHGQVLRELASHVAHAPSEVVEAMLNKQINMEFYASYVYLAMASFYGRDDQALHGFAKFFRKSADEERGHGLKLAAYQAQRGGRVVFQVQYVKDTCVESLTIS